MWLLEPDELHGICNSSTLPLLSLLPALLLKHVQEFLTFVEQQHILSQ